MKTTLFTIFTLAIFLCTSLALPDAYARQNPCNPCGGKMNPCNPCAKKPVIPIRKKQATSMKRLISMGEKMWNDEGLGKSGLSCYTCHDDYELLTNRPWPHYIKMASDILTLDQMINFCMLNPMEGKQLDPNSIRMTAIGAYYSAYMKNYKPAKKSGMDPCNPCNPCGKTRNPCNPCGR